MHLTISIAVPIQSQSHHTSSLGIIYSIPNTISVLPFLFSSLQRGSGKGSAHSHYGNYDTSSHSPLGNDTHSLSQIAYYFYTYVSSHSPHHHLKSGNLQSTHPSKRGIIIAIALHRISKVGIGGWRRGITSTSGAEFMLWTMVSGSRVRCRRRYSCDHHRHRVVDERLRNENEMPWWARGLEWMWTEKEVNSRRFEGSEIEVGDDNIRRCGTKGFTVAGMLMQPYARVPRVLQG